jgi:hypothetical protein
MSEMLESTSSSESNDEIVFIFPRYYHISKISHFSKLQADNITEISERLGLLDVRRLASTCVKCNDALKLYIFNKNTQLKKYAHKLHTLVKAHNIEIDATDKQLHIFPLSGLLFHPSWIFPYVLVSDIWVPLNQTRHEVTSSISTQNESLSHEGYQMS